MQSDVIEQVSFRARSPEADRRMAEAAWAAHAAFERLQGFVSRQFGRGEDGEWLDIIRWRSLEDARRAAQHAGREPTIAAFFGLIDMQSAQLRHYRAPAPAALWTRLPPPRQALMTVVLEDLAPTRAFYEQHFNARALFDAPGYVLLQLGGPYAPQLALMHPTPEDTMPCFAGGAVLNLQVDDVEALHARLMAAGVPSWMPLKDHAWGDRGFAVRDPAGLKLYCYRPQTPFGEYAHSFREPWRLEAPMDCPEEDLQTA
ncbi:VOC family protein [Aquimonas voraii]|uniref:Uncharacterized conserved protein PhnB, glyoxalase superfamily n=1 Tax=Aquimonas voraii TaxID=265719 RepID=A0A1G6UG22_9GAMM|nr:VOC family protein [Aquimonas voraii]SDD40348.1 Uncharacterized conserved protein PhnB, glyoxalase superfamily [Aquimonas voraii]